MTTKLMGPFLCNQCGYRTDSLSSAMKHTIVLDHQDIRKVAL